MKKVLSVFVLLAIVAAAASADEVTRIGALRDVWNFREAVHFNTNAASISAADRAILSSAAEAAKANSEAIISVEGHTDNRGSAAANQRLSVRRAQAVRNALVSRYGVNPRQIKVTGHGLDYPIASNESAEGMAKNRRVEIRIHKTGSPNIGSWTPWGTEVTITGPQTGTPNIGSNTPAGDMTPLRREGGRAPNVGSHTPPVNTPAPKPNVPSGNPAALSPSVGPTSPAGSQTPLKDAGTGRPNVGSSTPAGNQTPLADPGAGKPNIGTSTPAGDLTPVTNR